MYEFHVGLLQEFFRGKPQGLLPGGVQVLEKSIEPGNTEHVHREVDKAISSLQCGIDRPYKSAKCQAETEKHQAEKPNALLHGPDAVLHSGCRLFDQNSPTVLAHWFIPGEERIAVTPKCPVTGVTCPHLLDGLVPFQVHRRRVGIYVRPGGQVPVLVYQRYPPCAFKLGLYQLPAHRIEGIGSHENTDRLTPVVFYGDHNSHHQWVRCNGGLIHLGDVRRPLTSYAVVPVAVCEILVEDGWFRWIDRTHGSVEVVCADKLEVGAQVTGLLQLPCY